ncbi:hypothetical protein IAU60_000677 [Kwoniella sp. DSM 27419]
MLCCLPCLRLDRWWRSAGYEDDTPARAQDERRPLYTPPDTILTPPERRADHSRYPSLAGSIATSTVWASQPVSPIRSMGGSTFRPALERSTSTSRASREKMQSISRAYGGQMRRLPSPRPSSRSPSVFTAPSRPPSGSNLADSFRLHMNQDIGHGVAPRRPPAAGLGRSISEPRYLSDLAGHEADRLGGYLALNASRGRSRLRSATLGMDDRLSSVPTRMDLGDGRGRSPGPAFAPLMMTAARSSEHSPHVDTLTSDPLHLSLDRLTMASERGIDSQRTVGRSSSHPALNAAIGGHSASAHDDCEGPDVVVCDLGLRGFGTLGNRRGRSRGRSWGPRPTMVDRRVFTE